MCLIGKTRIRKEIRVFSEINLLGRVRKILESFFYIKGFEISIRDVNLVSKCLFSRSGHTTIQDGLLNKSRDLFSKASFVVCPLRENESFFVKMERFQIKQNVPNLK